MKTEKLVAPVIITVLLILYFLGFLPACIFLELPIGARLIGCLIPLVLIGISVFVLIERIKEIRSGEEDDLDNY